MEEKTYFQSTITHDLEADHEFMRFVRLTNRRMIVTRAISCILLCILIWATSILDNSWILIFYSGYFIVSSFISWLQLRNGSASYKQGLVVNHDKPITNIVSFTDEGVRSLNPDNGNYHDYDYYNVHRIAETQNSLILICKANLGVVVSKSNLTGGSREDFIAFLQSRCPNLNKKIQNDTIAKIFAGIYTLVLIVALLIGLFNLPVFSDMADTLNGRIPSFASYSEIAVALDEFGITGSNEALIESLEEYGSNYSYYDTAYYKTLDLLCWLGMGEYDEESWDWTPAQNGVYWFDAEVFDIEYMYTNFLNGVSALDDELDFQVRKEWSENANWEMGTGDQFVNFTWNGTDYILKGQVNYDWFDFQVADHLNEIIRQADTGKQLYFAYDSGQGVLVFYRDAQWAKEFQQKTGIKLHTDPNAIT